MSTDPTPERLAEIRQAVLDGLGPDQVAAAMNAHHQQVFAARSLSPGARARLYRNPNFKLHDFGMSKSQGTKED